jgi:hypothetical protein
MRGVLIYVWFDLKHIQGTLSNTKKSLLKMMTVVREVMGQEKGRCKAVKAENELAIKKT